MHGFIAYTVHRLCATHFLVYSGNFRAMERKCADTIGTVLVPRAGHFPMLKYKCTSEIKYTEAILSNCTRKQLWFEITKMLLIAVFKK